MDDLFFSVNASTQQPLATRLRPERLKDITGHADALKPGGKLSLLMRSGKNFSIVLTGPPGIGKTTIARAISRELDAHFVEFSATAAGTKDIREITSNAKKLQRYQGTKTICFVDEIHRFSRTQQDALLSPIENGEFLFIGATTENPFANLTPALISRLQVIQLEALSLEDLIDILLRAAKAEGYTLDPSLARIIADNANGDARAALKILEILAVDKKKKTDQGENCWAISADDITDDLIIRLGKGRDKSSHYELTSALIKSMRASDRKASLYYLARLLVSGEPPEFIARRLSIFASEDIGLADNTALVLANSCFELVAKLGMPESQYALGQTVIYLANAPKSQTTKHAILRAIEVATRTQHMSVPQHLRGSINAIEQRFVRSQNASLTSAFGGDDHKQATNLPPNLKGEDLL